LTILATKTNVRVPPKKGRQMGSTPTHDLRIFASSWLFLCHVLVLGLLVGAIVYQQYQLRITHATYQQQARKVLDRMYTTMVMAEELNVKRNGVMYAADKKSKTQELLKLPSVTLWTRVVYYDPKVEEQYPENAYDEYVWKAGVGYLPIDSALRNLWQDPAFRAYFDTLREQNGTITKSIRSLDPADRSTGTYQKIIRLHALFQQYIENTIAPPRNTMLHSASQYEIATDFMLLLRELNDELP